MADIAFLHTSPVHVATFDALMKEVAPQVTVSHLVREDLEALGLIAGVCTVLQSAAAHARVVVCSCSTLGGLAEATRARVPITRIDRAMAGEAVQLGAPVLMVAALQSTLEPTVQLLRSSAERLGLPLQSRSVCVVEAWPHFQAGRHEDCLAAIAADAPRSPA